MYYSGSEEGYELLQAQSNWIENTQLECMRSILSQTRLAVVDGEILMGIQK